MPDKDSETQSQSAPALAAARPSANSGLYGGSDGSTSVRGNVLAHPGFQSLQRSINRFAGALDQLQSAQSTADEYSQGGGGGQGGSVAGKAGYSRGAQLARSPSSVTLSMSPQIQEYRQTLPQPPAPPVNKAEAPSQAAPSAASPQSQTVAGVAPQQNTQAASPAATPPTGNADSANLPDQPSLYKNVHEYPNSNLVTSGKPLAIAMQVPNVISGIQIVHLGETASEAVRALEASRNTGALGSVIEVPLSSPYSGWTVVSANRVNSQEAAIQLYVKHGMVEALRVFDPRLMPPEIGVNLGDQLTSVKSKFGEPAFMISEPSLGRASSSGQNYVYPISQISFQLARVKKSTAPPQVVSMLIFNVK